MFWNPQKPKKKEQKPPKPKKNFFLKMNLQNQKRILKQYLPHLYFRQDQLFGKNKFLVIFMKFSFPLNYISIDRTRRAEHEYVWLFE